MENTQSLPKQLSRKEQISQKDPIIKEILGDLYKPEKILTRKVEHIDDGEYKITFLFPPYDRTIDPLDHVSMSQIHEAILEGLYCSIGQAIKNNEVDALIDFQTFQSNKLNTIYFRENLSFRKMLKANECADLTFKIVRVEVKRLRRQFYAVTVQINGFVRGEVECLLGKIDR